MGVPRNSPKIFPKKKTLQYLLDLDSGNNHKHGQLCSNPKCEEILSIIYYCSYIYTFTDPLETPLQQNLKRDKLMKLLSLIKSLKRPVPDEILSPLFAMISANLFRSLPPPNTSIICILPDDDDVFATPEAAWPHLQLVYDILLHLIISLEPNTLKGHINNSFLLNLLHLFQSEDPRERESLKNVYHRIYSNFTSYRSFMRKAMNDVFLHYISETDQKHSGIGDLLEIWGTIINGFSVPLKEEHKFFLTRVLIHLHRPKGMQVYYKQLAYCVYQFVEKEPVLGVDVLRGILRYWPVTNCQKEVLLIGELEELVEIMEPEQHRVLALPLCKQITRCLNSCNSQVAERALYIWNNEQFVKMASQDIEEVFPIVVEGMEKNLKWHWSQSVQQLTENVQEMLEEMEPSLYSKCLSQLDLRESATNQEEMRRKQRWESIEEAAKRNQYIQDSQLHVTN
ncbi:unnamed protein product [Fraxinus pennsylvanica]|uniref:Serine/threonine protein phosphatase 2A regulatory subunit n=1 Tax=Fraxinus pennsylvanica TaxID=56036 RepID=A0AAD1ZH97_9LAMI|nr:unnamed protein product [Fraxinus pennsylvanica]